MAPDLDLEAYLQRTGAKAPLGATLEGLASLHRAHCAAISFENLDILLGRPIDLDLGPLQAKLVRARRAGTDCGYRLRASWASWSIGRSPGASTALQCVRTWGEQWHVEQNVAPSRKQPSAGFRFVLTFSCRPKG